MPNSHHVHSYQN